jgi:hypothetical protein
MFCSISLQATTTKISSYMICQSYWKMYHWQSEHECGTWPMVLQHFSCAVQHVPNNTYYDWWIGIGGPTAWPSRLPDLNPRNLYLWEHLNTLVYAAQMERHFTIALWMPVRPSASTPVSLNGCGSPCWDVSRPTLNLMEDILSTFYKCTLSAMIHKLNVSRQVLVWIFFLVLLCWTHAQSCLHLSVTSCIRGLLNK